MGVIYLLLLILVIPGQMLLYQPLNIVSVEVNTTAVIPCISSEDTDKGLKIVWYQRQWASEGRPLLIKSCSSDYNQHKHTCKSDQSKSNLLISNVQTNDSGVYFCTFVYANIFKFGNGTYLNAGDRSTSKTSVHILIPVQPPLTNSSLQLACVVHEAHDIIHITWNISGAHHKGQMTSKKESNGTKTLMNLISLHGGNWNPGELVICEVWLSSSPISVHWLIHRKDDLHVYLPSECQIFLMLLVIAGILLLLTLSVHLIRTYSLPGAKTQASIGKDTVTKDELVYSELNLTRRRPL